MYKLNPDIPFILIMEVVPEPNIVSDRTKAFLDDPQWPEYIKDHELKQIKRKQIPNIYNNNNSYS